MSKGKYQVELKIKIVQEYLTGKQSVKSLANQYGVGVTSIKVIIPGRKTRLSLSKRAGLPSFESVFPPVRSASRIFFS